MSLVLNSSKFEKPKMFLICHVLYYWLLIHFLIKSKTECLPFTLQTVWLYQIKTSNCNLIVKVNVLHFGNGFSPSISTFVVCGSSPLCILRQKKLHHRSLNCLMLMLSRSFHDLFR